VIPLFKVFMAKEVNQYILPVLHSGYIGEGEKVQLFEKAISKIIQNDNVVAVNSGTAAITMALRLCGAGHNDYVMTTPMTCLATNEPILSLGAIPVWVDVERDGMMDPIHLETRIRVLPKKPKAILCMDWGGTPCRLDSLKAVGDQFDVPLIEDACQALGSVYRDKPVGNHADYVAFSFQAIKYITSVDGGALIVNTDKLKEAQLMRWFGLDRTLSSDMRCSQDPVTWGYKFHMNDVSASIGLSNIGHLPGLLQKTKRNAEMFNTLGKCVVEPHRESNYWLYTILVEDVPGFIKYMADNKIACSQVHDRNDTKQMFKQNSITLKGVDYFDKHHVCIPVGWWLKALDVEYIIETVYKYDSR